MTLLLDHTGTPIRTQRKHESRTVRVRASYDAAHTSTDNEKHWALADGLSAAAANSPDVRRVLRNRARYECANNSYASGMIRTLANNVIGVGPSLQMNSGDTSADTQVEMAFWKWSRKVRLAEKLRTARMTRCRDGEVFLHMFQNFALRGPIKLDVRLYEGDQVALPLFDVPVSNSDGIIFDDFGNPLAYTLLREHPGEHFESFSGEYDVIPARNMIHMFSEERPGQLRGVPEILSSLSLFGQLRRYTLAVIAAAETAAAWGAILHTQSSVEDPDDVEPLDVFDLERRSIMSMPRGWDAKQMKGEQPVTTYPQFKREIISESARCIGQPYNIASGDSSGYNYASGRLDHQTYFESVDIDRDYNEVTAMEVILERWWEEAYLVTRNGTAEVLPPAVFDREPQRHEWRWPGHKHVDPLKEANAQKVRLESNTTTLARECSQEGLDWEDVLDQRAKERKRMKELGLLEDPVSQRPPEPDEESDDE